MKAKKALIRKSAFLKSPMSLGIEPSTAFEIICKAVTEKTVSYTLMTQSAAKAPGQDKINFRVFTHDMGLG